MEHASLHARAREKGVNPLMYWLVRGVLQPFFHLYFRLSRIGREHIPATGPVILASNHRSFLDPFILATIARRPLYYVAKEELFTRRFTGWLLNNLGAFPVRRGEGDADMIDTAKAILARGDAVLIFPEGTRIRPGALGRPRRGVGRLALETGAPVVPVAIIGTEAIRKGWRVRPHKVRVRVGRAAHLPDRAGAVAHARRRRHRPHLALRDAPVGVARRPAAAAPRRRHRRRLVGHRGRRSCSPAPASRSTSAAAPPTRPTTSPPPAATTSTCPDAELPESIRVMRAADLELSRHDIVCFAVPSAGLPSAVAAHGGSIPKPHRRARDVEGPRAAARLAAVRLRRRARQQPGRSARSPAPPTPPPRSAAAPRWWSARATPPSAARSRPR